MNGVRKKQNETKKKKNFGASLPILFSKTIDRNYRITKRHHDIAARALMSKSIHESESIRGSL